jgi:glycosyltransferase involved in cell wall biosynthesis
MTSGILARTAIASIKHAPDRAGELSWAHVSGWSHTSTRARTVSCVIATHNAAPRLARLLPDLSDRLTEVGFPWEITCVDAASTDDTGLLLSYWTEYPGFGWIRLEHNYGAVAAIQTGLSRARGDAVILINATASDARVDWVPAMIAKWDEGNQVVFVGDDPANEPGQLACWNLDDQRNATHADEAVRITMHSSEMLLDRRMVKLLLHSETD